MAVGKLPGKNVWFQIGETDVAMEFEKAARDSLNLLTRILIFFTISLPQFPRESTQKRPDYVCPSTSRKLWAFSALKANMG